MGLMDKIKSWLGTGTSKPGTVDKPPVDGTDKPGTVDASDDA